MTGRKIVDNKQMIRWGGGIAVVVIVILLLIYA